MTTSANPTSSTPAAALGTRWVLDAAHSDVSFSVRHMMISNIRGDFQKASGEVTYDKDRPEASRISVTIDVASIPHARGEARRAPAQR